MVIAADDNDNAPDDDDDKFQTAYRVSLEA
jgi:hypothetical protein